MSAPSLSRMRIELNEKPASLEKTDNLKLAIDPSELAGPVDAARLTLDFQNDESVALKPLRFCAAVHPCGLPIRVLVVRVATVGRR